MTNPTSSQNPAQMNPITETEYALIAENAQQARPGETPEEAALRGATDIAAVGLMRDGMLRLREAAEVRWDHLLREADGSGRLIISISKADLGHVVYVSPRTMTALEEMRSIKQAMGIDIESDDHIFQMGSQQLSRRIRRACSFAGLKGRYGGHSPRIGMAMDLVRMGVSVVGLMAAGRWKNPAIHARIIRNLDAATGAVAQWHARNQSTDTPA